MNPLTIVIGLGNPGARYRSTRHNIGFRVIDEVAARHRVRLADQGDLKSRVWTAELPTEPLRCVLAKPRTYMNRSGRAASALCRHYGAASEDLVVVYDDADLALGRVRIRPGGGAGGHNGIRSMIEVLGTGEFGRVRLGVRGEGRDEADLADYVLDAFRPEERATADALVGLGADAVESVLADGLATAMNRFNASDVTREGGDS